MEEDCTIKIEKILKKEKEPEIIEIDPTSFSDYLNYTAKVDGLPGGTPELLALEIKFDINILVYEFLDGEMVLQKANGQVLKLSEIKNWTTGKPIILSRTNKYFYEPCGLGDEIFVIESFLSERDSLYESLLFYEKFKKETVESLRKITARQLKWLIEIGASSIKIDDITQKLQDLEEIGMITLSTQNLLEKNKILESFKQSEQTKELYDGFKTHLETMVNLNKDRNLISYNVLCQELQCNHSTISEKEILDSIVILADLEEKEKNSIKSKLVTMLKKNLKILNWRSVSKNNSIYKIGSNIDCSFLLKENLKTSKGELTNLKEIAIKLENLLNEKQFDLSGDSFVDKMFRVEVRTLEDKYGSPELAFSNLSNIPLYETRKSFSELIIQSEYVYFYYILDVINKASKSDKIKEFEKTLDKIDENSKIYLFMGESKVGKSSLINALTGYNYSVKKRPWQLIFQEKQNQEEQPEKVGNEDSLSCTIIPKLKKIDHVKYPSFDENSYFCDSAGIDDNREGLFALQSMICIDKLMKKNPKIFLIYVIDGTTLQKGKKLSFEKDYDILSRMFLPSQDKNLSQQDRDRLVKENQEKIDKLSLGDHILILINKAEPGDSEESEEENEEGESQGSWKKLLEFAEDLPNFNFRTKNFLRLIKTKDSQRLNSFPVYLGDIDLSPEEKTKNLDKLRLIIAEMSLPFNGKNIQRALPLEELEIVTKIYQDSVEKIDEILRNYFKNNKYLKVDTYDYAEDLPQLKPTKSKQINSIKSDIGKFEQMLTLLTEIENKFEAFNGVIDHFTKNKNLGRPFHDFIEKFLKLINSKNDGFSSELNYFIEAISQIEVYIEEKKKKTVIEESLKILKAIKSYIQNEFTVILNVLENFLINNGFGYFSKYICDWILSISKEDEQKRAEIIKESMRIVDKFKNNNYLYDIFLSKQEFLSEELILIKKIINKMYLLGKFFEEGRNYEIITLKHLNDLATNFNFSLTALSENQKDYDHQKNIKNGELDIRRRCEDKFKEIQNSRNIFESFLYYIGAWTDKAKISFESEIHETGKKIQEAEEIALKKQYEFNKIISDFDLKKLLNLESKNKLQSLLEKRKSSPSPLKLVLAIDGGYHIVNSLIAAQIVLSLFITKDQAQSMESLRENINVFAGHSISNILVCLINNFETSVRFKFTDLLKILANDFQEILIKFFKFQFEPNKGIFESLKGFFKDVYSVFFGPDLENKIKKLFGLYNLIMINPALLLQGKIVPENCCEYDYIFKCGGSSSDSPDISLDDLLQTVLPTHEKSYESWVNPSIQAFHEAKKLYKDSEILVISVGSGLLSKENQYLHHMDRQIGRNNYVRFTPNIDFSYLIDKNKVPQILTEKKFSELLYRVNSYTKSKHFEKSFETLIGLMESKLL